jgi:DNA-binding transcriptional MocR family regulator
MREAVGRHFPPGTRVTEPDGGFLLWVEMAPGVDALRLFEEAHRAGVSISPGPVFSPRLRFRNCLRLNCGHAWSERIEQAVALVGRLVTQAERASARRSRT